MEQGIQQYLIALGANLPSEAGPPAVTLGVAISQLRAAGVAIRAVSRFFATPAWPAGTGPDYVNAAVAAASAVEPHGLLVILHEIEAELGRRRAARWGARSLDLDLLACGARVLPDRAGFARWMNLAPEQQRCRQPDGLVLPHPRLHERAFVLGPLRDIAPRWRHPVLGRDVTDLWAELPPERRAEIRPL